MSSAYPLLETGLLRRGLKDAIEVLDLIVSDRLALRMFNRGGMAVGGSVDVRFRTS